MVLFKTFYEVTEIEIFIKVMQIYFIFPITVTMQF